LSASLRDSAISDLKSLQGVTRAGHHPLRDSTPPRGASSKPVTRLTCSRCHCEIADETVYRPHVHTFCARCFLIEKDRLQRESDAGKYVWYGYLFKRLAAPLECEVCGRMVVLSLSYDGARRRASRRCSSTCDSKFRRDRKRREFPCSGCGHTFQQRRKDQRYCSSTCKQKAYRERERQR